MKNLKPHICELVKYYYEDLDNPTGGYLHVVLDDGNVGDGVLYSCQQDCLSAGDTFGYFLATLLREFTEDERADMYEMGWERDWATSEKIYWSG